MDPERKQELLDKWHKALFELSMKNRKESAQWTGSAWGRWQRQEQELEEEYYDDETSEEETSEVSIVFSECIRTEEAKKQNDYNYNPGDEFGACFIPQSISADCVEYMKLIGGEFDFHGAQENMVRLNGMVYEFLEDPKDGFRSHLGAVRITPASEHTGFFPNPIARVILVSTADADSWPDGWTPPEEEEFYGFFLIDADDYHIWTQIGTEYQAYEYDWYPCFVTRYSPKNQNN